MASKTKAAAQPKDEAPEKETPDTPDTPLPLLGSLRCRRSPDDQGRQEARLCHP